MMAEQEEKIDWDELLKQLPDPNDENPDDYEYGEEDWEPLPEDTGNPFMDELNKRLNESDREYFKNAERINGEIVHRVTVGGKRKGVY